MCQGYIRRRNHEATCQVYVSPYPTIYELLKAMLFMVVEVKGNYDPSGPSYRCLEEVRDCLDTQMAVLITVQREHIEMENTK